MGILDSVVGILKVKIKPRKDAYSDQFSRIFLLKFMTVGAMFTGLTWYSDKINCLSVDVVDGGFASTACWINGFYIYDDIKAHPNSLGYYGIPDNINNNGRYENGAFCDARKSPTCKPMKKTFYLQYQYLTFFLIGMGALYYAPYIFFKYVNTDLASLKDSVEGGNAEAIVNSYFNRHVNPSMKLNLRIIGNFASKLLYVISNVLVFVLTDLILGGNYQSYGVDYNKWASQNSSYANDYTGARDAPKAGNVLLPSFVLCDIHEGAADIKHKVVNQHTLLCELSQHVIFQYIFVLLWWGMIVGVAMSVIGLLLLFVDYGYTMMNMKRKLDTPGTMSLSIRECEYLDYIHKKDIPLFGDVVGKLKDQRKKGLLSKKPIFKATKVEHSF